MSKVLSRARRRRLLDRARRSQETSPQLCLDNVEQILLHCEVTSELLLLKSRALVRLGRFTEARNSWEELLRLWPDEIEVMLEALNFFQANYDYPAMKRVLSQFYEDPPDREDALRTGIRVAQAVRAPDMALELCQRLVALCPENIVHRCKLATLYQSNGRMTEAECEYERVLSINPDYQPAWYFLAQLKKWESDNNHIVELTGFLERHESTGVDTSAAQYAKAKELEDLGLFEEAFHYLQCGARQIRARTAYDIQQDRKLFSALRDWYSSSTPQGGTGVSQEGPVFILGMPRTGSTLTDRILSSHSEVESVGELDCFKRAIEESCGGLGQNGFFGSLFGKAPPDLPYHEIGSRYFDMLAPLTTGKRFFIDKMPMNYVFVGLIARALPGARFIHTQRNPMDTCFSNYKQMFGKGYYGYSYDLNELAAYYTLYTELMAFWHSQLPGQIYNLEYESLVAEPEAETQKLLHWLNLSWEPECMEFHQSRDVVNTASMSQVRQPIYSGSVGKWRKFEPQLKPLLAALEKHQMRPEQ
jgi:tetratricopeptide (TPR) repeat protein